jgi:bifunctional DNase/RNase
MISRSRFANQAAAQRRRPSDVLALSMSRGIVPVLVHHPVLERAARRHPRPDAEIVGGAKRLGLLHELLPSAARFAVLVNRGVSPSIELLIREVQEAATSVTCPFYPQYLP